MNPSPSSSPNHGHALDAEKVLVLGLLQFSADVPQELLSTTLRNLVRLDTSAVLRAS